MSQPQVLPKMNQKRQPVNFRTDTLGDLPPDNPPCPPDPYRPPVTLAAAQAAARHFRASSLMHAGENEALSRQITSLKREINRLAGDRSLPGIRRLELRNQTLEDENARLRAELRTATASWRRLEVEARSTTELYAFSKAMIRRVAALEAERGERRHDPAVAAIQQ